MGIEHNETAVETKLMLRLDAANRDVTNLKAILGRLVYLHQLKDTKNDTERYFYERMKPGVWKEAYEAVGKEMSDGSPKEAQASS